MICLKMPAPAVPSFPLPFHLSQVSVLSRPYQPELYFFHFALLWRTDKQAASLVRQALLYPAVFIPLEEGI